MPRYIYRCTKCETAIERKYPLAGAPLVYVDRCPDHPGYSTEFQREGLHPDDEPARADARQAAYE